MFCLSGLISARSQQLTTSSFHDLYGVLHNPATTASGKQASIGASFRSMWDGIPGSPRTGVVFGSAYLKDHKIGIGGYLYSDVTGPTTRTGMQMAYAYYVPLSDKARFSIGLEGRFQQFSLDQAKLQQSLGSYDPVTSGDGVKYKGDAGVGLAYTTDKFQVGASVSQIIQSKINLYQGTGNPTEEAKLYRHYYLHGTYTFRIDEATRLTTNTMIIYLPNAPVEVQGGGRVEHQNLFWYGLSWRYRQAWMISAGIRIGKQLNLGYSFDIYSTPLSLYDKGSNGHEVMLRYDFIK